MSSFVLSQLLATATLLIGMTAFQFRDRVWILRGWFIAALFAAAHFFVLGQNAAGVLVAVTAIRFLVSSFTTNARLMYLFLALTIGGFIPTYANPVSLLALIATVIGTVGSFRGSQNGVRYSMMATEILWAIHNIIIWSPVGVAMEVLFFGSNLIGWLRHRRATAAAAHYP